MIGANGGWDVKPEPHPDEGLGASCAARHYRTRAAARVREPSYSLGQL